MENHYGNPTGNMNTVNYTYDRLNRLNQSVSTLGVSDEAVTYNINGNILNLVRTSGATLTTIVDTTLAYTYANSGQSNTLTAVTKNSAAFKAYTYDGNGNALSDGINRKISYNLLNLPQFITIGTTKIDTFTYDADGIKLRNQSAVNGKWDYINGIVYLNGSIDFIQTEEGRASIIAPNTAFTYTYDFKDYLGNVRGSFDNGNGTGIPRLVQEDNYYAFGLDQKYYDLANGNRYLYNGKEKQLDLGNQYDYGARFYDPVIGRFTSIDPLAEGMRRHSTYTYGFDNPIRFIDPDGMGNRDFVDRKGKIVWDPNATSKTTTQPGDTYLGKNVIVATENRGADGNEPINSATFAVYLESNHDAPVATATGNTVPADVTEYGTLKDGIYPASVGSRTKYPDEKAIMIGNRGPLPTVSGNPNDPKGETDPAKQTLTGVFIHQGNTGRESLTTSKGKPISEGCQTVGNGTAGAMDTFMENVPDNFSGVYYLRPTPVATTTTAPTQPSTPTMQQDATKVVHPPQQQQ